MTPIYRLLFTTVIISLSASSLYAKDTTFISANNIQDLSSTLVYVKKHSSLPVLFPVKIPASASNKLYATHTNTQTFWTISISNAPGCETRSCMVGSVSAEKNKKMERDYLQAPFDASSKPLPKQKVILTNHATAYFTPGHAEADWHAPSIEWITHGVLYRIDWNMKGNEKATLTTLANSALLSS